RGAKAQKTNSPIHINLRKSVFRQNTNPVDEFISRKLAFRKTVVCLLRFTNSAKRAVFAEFCFSRVASCKRLKKYGQQMDAQTVNPKLPGPGGRYSGTFNKQGVRRGEYGPGFLN